MVTHLYSGAVMLLLGAISTWIWIDLVLILILAWLLGSQLYWWYRGKKVAHIVESNEFKQGLRKGQIVDLRDSDAFERSHILGARNMPFAQFQLYENALRKDAPVYLYDTTKAMPIRIAARLKKQGFNDIYILKGGYSKWDGKKKTRKA